MAVDQRALSRAGGPVVVLGYPRGRLLGRPCYKAVLAAVDETPLARVGLNRVAHRRAFPKGRIEPWIAHHIEEIGNLEHFLPGLYVAEAA